MSEKVVNDWLDQKEDMDKSWYQTCVRASDHFLNWIEKEGIEPTNTKFKSGDVENFDQYLQEEKNWADNTIKNHVMAFRDLIQFAVKNRYGWDAYFQEKHPLSIYQADISRNNLQYEEETGEDIPYITENEHTALMEENENPRDDVILSTLWDTGVRPHELRNLKIDDVDENKLISDRSITVKTAKRDDHYRDVYLTPSTRSKWVFWLYKGKRDAYSNSSHSSEYVFPTQRTEKMSQNTINRQIKRLADRAGVQEVAYKNKAKTYLRGEMQTVDRDMVEINAKSYRHSFAVRACKNGINLSLLADLMGHSDTSSLESYTKFLPDDRKEAFERFIH